MTTNLLWEEFKLVQEKVDKIGDFRFRVKGWAMTLITGLFAAALTQKASTAYCLAALPVVALFQLMERRQIGFERALTARLTELERSLRRVARTVDIGTYDQVSPAVVEAFQNSTRSRSRKTRGCGLGRWLRDNHFYVTLYLFILGLFVVKAVIGDPSTRSIDLHLTVQERNSMDSLHESISILSKPVETSDELIDLGMELAAFTPKLIRALRSTHSRLQKRLDEGQELQDVVECLVGEKLLDKKYLFAIEDLLSYVKQIEYDDASPVDLNSADSCREEFVEALRELDVTK